MSSIEDDDLYQDPFEHQESEREFHSIMGGRKMQTEDKQKILDEHIQVAIGDEVHTPYDIEFHVDSVGARHIDLRFESEDEFHYGLDKVSEILDEVYDIEDVEYSVHIIAKHKETGDE